MSIKDIVIDPDDNVIIPNESIQTIHDNCDAYYTMVDEEGNLIGGGHGYKKKDLCDHTPCKSGKISISDIMKNINCTIKYAEKAAGCCDKWQDEFTEIRGKLVGKMLYLTSDNSDPKVAVLPRPIPKTHTFMNHEEMQNIYWNHKPVLGMWMDGILVFYKPIHLHLPQFSNTFVLSTWITKELTKLGKLKEARYLIIDNAHNQPTMKTGDLSKWDTVEMHNNGSFVGTNPCNDALIVESKMYLFNKGWIKGAGGNGKAGSPGKAGHAGATVPGIPGKVTGHRNVVYGVVDKIMPVKGAGCPAGWCIGAVDFFEIAGMMTTGGSVYRARHDVGYRWSGGSIWEGAGQWGPWQKTPQAAHGSIPGYGGPGVVYHNGMRFTVGGVIYQEGQNFPAGNRLFAVVRALYAQHYRTVPIMSGGKPAIKGGSGGKAGKAGTAGVGQSFKTKQKNGGPGGHGGSAGSTPHGGHAGTAGTSGTAGSNGGIWGQDGAACHAGKAIRGKGNLIDYAKYGPGQHIGGIV